MHSLVNSLLICVTTAVAVTAFAALAAYALSRVRIPGRDALLYGLLLLSSVVTGTAAMVPIFVMMFQLGLIDSRFGVVAGDDRRTAAGGDLHPEGLHRRDAEVLRGVGPRVRRHPRGRSCGTSCCRWRGPAWPPSWSGRS